MADSLATYAAKGSRVEAGRLRAAIQRSQAVGRSEVRALPLCQPKSSAAKDPLFPEARSLVELLDEFKGIHGVSQAAPVAMDTDAPPSSSSAAAAAHAHELTVPITTQFNQELLSRYAAERVVSLSGLVAKMAPSPQDIHRTALDVAYVRRLLSEPYGGFTSCTNKACFGYTLPGKFALMGYVSPEQMAHYDLTGSVPTQQPMCYLCALSIMATAVDLAASAKSGVHTVHAPFFHPINCPGGYVSTAMHRSVIFGSSIATTHPIRRLDVSEYKQDEREVYVPKDGAPLMPNGWAQTWEKRTVSGYSESASLMFGSNYMPSVAQLAAPVCIVGVGELPPCERLLSDKFLLPSAMCNVLIKTVENESVNGLNLALPIVSTLGGPLHAGDMMQAPVADAHPQQVLWSLCWSDFMLARARLVHLINANGNDTIAVARRFWLLPTQHQHYRMESPQAVEVRYSFKLHMVFYLTMARLNEIDRLLETPRPKQLGAAWTRDERDMVERAFMRPGVEDQLKAYRAALAPLVGFFFDRMRAGTAIDDSVLFSAGERTLRWFELRPAPSPNYFSPGDLTTYPLSVAAIPATAPGSVVAAEMNSLLPADRDAAPMPLYEGVWDGFWESVATLNLTMEDDEAPCMAYWQPRADKFVFHLSQDVALTLDQVRGDENDDDDEQDEKWTERLHVAMENACNMTIWRAIVYRINVCAWFIHKSTTRLVDIDRQLATIGDRANSWLPSQCLSELAVRVFTAHAKATTDLSLDTLVEQVSRNMPAVADEAVPLVEEQRRITTLVQALKQFMASHLPLVSRAILKRAVTDDEMRPLVAEALPTPYGAVGAVCDETMMCMASELDGIEFLHDVPDSSLYSWVMSGVVPTSARVSDLVARHRDAVEKSEEYEEFSRQILYAHLVGAYPHARNVATFDVWLRAHLLLFAAPTEISRRALDFYMESTQVENAETNQMESTERIFFLALREHFVRTLELAPAYRLSVLANYLAYPQFADDVRRHSEHVRSGVIKCSLYDINRVLLDTYNKTSQAWPTYHRAPASFPAFMAECCKSVDIDRAIDACEKARAVLPNADLRPPAFAIRGIGAYVESHVLPHELYQEMWMRDVGLSEDGVAVMNRLYAEHKGHAVNVTSGTVKLTRLAAQHPVDYQTVSVFFAVMQQHISRRVVPLDFATALKQRNALSERNMLNVHHAGQCVMSSVQCCNTMRTFVIQDGSAFQGTLPMRLNLDTNKSMCVPKRGKQYTSARAGERELGSQSVRDKIKSYFELYDSPTRTELDDQELKVRRASMREVLRSHVQTLSKSRYVLDCGTMEVMRWPALGYITVQGDQACTVCPRCGNKTAYSPAMFSTNGFTCGYCDNQMQEALERSNDDRCALCLQTPRAVSRAMRNDHSERRYGARERIVELIDDTASTDVMTYRSAWVCAMCNSERWVIPAAETFTLSELRWLRAHSDAFRGQLAELKDPHDWELMRRDYARARAAESVEFPVVHSVQSIPKIRRVKRRLGTQRV